MNVTSQQLAEILIGVARTQQAIIDAIESLKAGFKGTHFAPALDTVAKLRTTGRALSLQELPARILLQCQGRAGPNLEMLVRDLDALLSGQPLAPATVPASAARPPATPAPAAVPISPPRAAAPPPPPVSPAASAPIVDNDLDMTKL
jgi:hypothetical protein